MKKVLMLVLSIISVVVISSNYFKFMADEPTNKGFSDVSTNLIVDGGFEAVTETVFTPWQRVVGAQDQARAGHIEIISGAGDPEATVVNSAYRSVGQSIWIYTSASSNDYPELYQVITVKPNTDYDFSFKLRNNLPMTSGNLYFGFGSSDYAAGYDYVQQHKWIDTLTNHNYDGTNEEFTLISGKFNSGNRTSLRAFIRLGKLNVAIDDVVVSELVNLIPLGKTNLLSYPGFEGTDQQNNSVWAYEGVENRTLFGYDDVRTTAVYTPGTRMQDKQIEGFKNLYFGVSAGGGEHYPLVKQAVTVTPNTDYTFYVNLTGWGTIWGAYIGIADSEGNDLAFSSLGYQDISTARYILVSSSANTGNNTVVFPYIKAHVGPTSGQWGSGLQVDDTYFVESNDTPTGKTNLITNSLFTNKWSDTTSDWSGWSGTYKEGKNGSWQSWIDDFGYETYNTGWITGQAFSGSGVFKIKSDYQKETGIYQNVTLTAGKLYDLVARVMLEQKDEWKQEIEDDGNSWFCTGYYQFVQPLVVRVYSENGNVLNQEYRLERDVAFKALGGVFSVETTGEYTVFIGFDESTSPIWAGYADVGSVALFEVTEQEVTPPVEENPDGYIFSSNENVVIQENKVVSNVELTVEAFILSFQTIEGFTVTVVDSSNNVVSGTEYLSNSFKLRLLTESGTLYHEYTIQTVEHVEEEEETTTPDVPKKGCKSVVSTGIGIVVTIITIGSICLLKKKQEDK